MNANDEEKEIRKWAMLCHFSSMIWIPLSVISGFVGIPIIVPFVSIFGPLCVWQFQKNLDPAIDDHGKESLNFQLSLLIYGIILAILCFLLVSVTCGLGMGTNSTSVFSTAGIMLFFGGVAISLIMGIGAFILVIFAAIKASKGEFYRYPFTIRFLK
ncbi:MAG: hypothetical protein RLZZ338_1576 [Cyanobacteriota bacterium]|jgi:uncharacterized Tic20 family protein